jgi:hypothetical protein
VSSGSKRGKRGPQVVGLINHRRDKRPCGICGVRQQLTRAHVPPRCAGNELLVKRYHILVTQDDGLTLSGRQEPGGIHLYGLCDDCNSQAGAKYDDAYGDFANALRPHRVKSWQLQVPHLMSTPGVAFDPGAVVRSILLGMCATGSLIREHWPGFPVQLLSGASVQLPPELRLYLGFARGLTARVSGAISGFHIAGPHLRRGSGGQPLGINAVASVYFPPLAWQLVHAGESILDREKWADVSGWTAIDPGETYMLSDLVPVLPVVCHPRHHPGRDEGWIEFLNDKIAPIIECANVDGGPPDPLAPTLDPRKHVSMTEMNEILIKNGLPALPVDAGA